ncbi:MAG: hypothetical protein ACT4P7_22535 [Gemmatimonadaceae bacterium]
MRTPLPVALAALALVAATACAKQDADMVDTTPAAAPAPPPTPSISVIEVGRSIGANRRVLTIDSVFATRDTIYLSVVTENAPASANLMTKWTFVPTGQLVDSTAQTVAMADAGSSTSVTEFHISKPSGWPTGRYRVEIFLDGVSQGTREFEVKK